MQQTLVGLPSLRYGPMLEVAVVKSLKGDFNEV